MRIIPDIPAREFYNFPGDSLTPWKPRFPGFSRNSRISRRWARHRRITYPKGQVNSDLWLASLRLPYGKSVTDYVLYVPCDALQANQANPFMQAFLAHKSQKAQRTAIPAPRRPRPPALASVFTALLAAGLPYPSALPAPPCPCEPQVRRRRASATTAGPKTIPPFSLPDLEGKMHHPKDWKGKVVLIDFWATWCVKSAARPSPCCNASRPNTATRDWWWRASRWTRAPSKRWPSSSAR